MSLERPPGSAMLAPQQSQGLANLLGHHPVDQQCYGAARWQTTLDAQGRQSAYLSHVAQQAALAPRNGGDQLQGLLRAGVSGPTLSDLEIMRMERDEYLADWDK